MEWVNSWSRWLVVVMCAGLLHVGAAKAEPSDASKLQLKAAVLAHIADHTANDLYNFIDHESTQREQLRFLAMHPVIFVRDDGTYALCADFQDDRGNKVLIDYYVADMNGRLVVLASVKGQRSLLMRMAERFNL